VDRKDLNYLRFVHASLCFRYRSCRQRDGIQSARRAAARRQVLRTLNRMPRVTYRRIICKAPACDEDAYTAYCIDNGVGVRPRVGMEFQRPNPFPTCQFADNVWPGLKMQGVCATERCFDDTAGIRGGGANLWDESRDRLGRPGGGLPARLAATAVYQRGPSRCNPMCCS